MSYKKKQLILRKELKFSMRNKKTIAIIEIILTLVILLINVIFFSSKETDWVKYVSFGLYVLAYLIIGGRILIKAIKNILKGRVFDEFFLMSLATIVAFILQDYLEGVAVMLFYQIGELFQTIAVEKSRKSIQSLMEIAPNHAFRIKEDQSIEKIDVDEVRMDDVLLIKAGEKIPVDGIILDGSSTLDTSSLTGESLPLEVNKGDSVLSGNINLNGVLTMKATKVYEESTIYKILNLIEEAAESKGKTEQFITRFSKIYTPSVVLLAILVALVPPLFTGFNFSFWIYRALSFLVISCPCALVISIPLSFFSGMGNLSRKGILIKGGVHLENLAKAKTFFFDKTGTLTKGKFKVSSVHVMKNEDLFYSLLISMEKLSTHPLAKTIVASYPKVKEVQIQNEEEISGKGIKGYYLDEPVLVGNAKLLKEEGIEVIDQGDTIIHVAYHQEYLGYVLLEDEIKEDALITMDKLHRFGVQNLIMITGDKEEVAAKVSSALHLDAYYASLLPQDKLEIVQKEKEKGRKTCYLGDGINDAPTLAMSDVSISMGKNGSSLAIESSDIVLMDDHLNKASEALRIAKRTVFIAYFNIIFALIVKVLCMVLGGLGIGGIFVAIFADVGVMILCVLLSMSNLYLK